MSDLKTGKIRVTKFFFLIQYIIQRQKTSIKTESEISILLQAKHSNIVRYYTSYRRELSGIEWVDIVMELCHGTIEDYRNDPSLFPKFSNQSICSQSAQGLDYLHNQMQKTIDQTWYVVHKDIKPTNILLSNNDGNVKLTDFNISKQIECQHDSFENTNTCTPDWSAPELQMKGDAQRPLTKAYDIFSLGTGKHTHD